MKKTVFTLFGCFFAIALLVACGDDEAELTGKSSIHGCVAMNGEPVASAAVLLTPGGGMSITGSDGQYSFSGLTGGSYEIKVYKEGCLPFNKTIMLKAGVNENLDLTLSANNGALQLDKGFVDLGASEGNNVGAVTIINTSSQDIEWIIDNATSWITSLSPANGTIPAGGRSSITFTIDRNKLLKGENYAALIVRSTTAGMGGTAELLVTAIGRETNEDNNNPTVTNTGYIVIDGLYIQRQDLGGKMCIEDAYEICDNSRVGGFDDWRLPTRSELALMYQNRKTIGGFTTSQNDGSEYWSISGDKGWHPAFCFATGVETDPQWDDDNPGYLRYDAEARVRAVRQDKANQSFVVLTAANLMVQVNDMGIGTYEEAETACHKSNKGGFDDWRLPTVSEWRSINADLDKVGNLKTGEYYWAEKDYASDPYSDTSAAIRIGGTGSANFSTTSQLRIRAVRSIFERY